MGIDWRVPRGWLQACKVHHAGSCENRWKQFFDASLNPPGMRLVDVNKMTIFMLPAQPVDGSMVQYKYAVLSYTWGGVQKTKIENPSRTEIDLAPYYQQLAKTIKDAIVTTREMGLDFLLVDALCIQSRVEGDEEAMKADEGKQVQEMHKIYGQACFCIVAAGGESANDGLWSTVRDPESKQPTTSARPEFVPPGSVELDDRNTIAVPLPLPGDISKCKWASRAWCLQEQLFSTRYLVFFDNQIYFQCKKRMWFEDMSLEQKQAIFRNKSNRVLGQIKDINIDFTILENSKSGSQNDHVKNIDGTLTVVRSPIFTGYQSIVSLYSTREMTNPGDAIYAVDGLLSVIKASMQTEVIFGLPESMLDAALLWRGEDILEPRGRGTQTSEATLPSWSWAGWKGYVGYDKPVEFDRKTRKLAQIWTSGGSRSYPEYSGPFAFWYKPRKYPNSTDAPDGAFGELAPVNDTGLGIRIPEGRLPENWPLISKMPTYQEALAEQKKSTALEPTHLHLLTMCTEDFELSSKPPGALEVSPQQRYIYMTLDDGNMRVVSEIWRDGKSHQEDRKESNEALVVISSARYFKTHTLNETWAVYDHIPGCYLYNVLLVEFVEKVKVVSNITQKYKVAYRKGIGRITKEEWRIMNPKVEFIRLGLGDDMAGCRYFEEISVNYIHNV
ncbi:Heterokaryon incompatibility protein [Rutstroemia sp. NJR-2017a BVV2]|nr:Heterokaryon incompatibility protein [Rutstroemia sp. NJR-2017a BVV2]